MLNGDENVDGERGSVCELVQNLQHVQLDTQNKQECNAAHTGASINDIDDRIGKHCSVFVVLSFCMLKICDLIVWFSLFNFPCLFHYSVMAQNPRNHLEYTF